MHESVDDGCRRPITARGHIGRIRQPPTQALERRQVPLGAPDQVCVDPRRMHEADCDAEVCHLLAVGQSEHLDSSLAGTVGGQSGQGHERQRRRDDHRVPAAAFQMRRRIFEGPEDACHVDVQHPLERGIVRLADRAVGHDAGIGQDQIDAAHRLGAGIERCAQRRAVTHIRVPPGRRRAELIGKRPQPLRFEPDESQLCPPGSGKACDSLADAACSTGHDQPSTQQSPAHVLNITSLYEFRKWPGAHLASRGGHLPSLDGVHDFAGAELAEVSWILSAYAVV